MADSQLLNSGISRSVGLRAAGNFAAGEPRFAVQRFARAMGLCLSLLCFLVAGPTRADDVSKEEMRSLDEQLQQVKSDVLGIAAELNQLEEKLLYPSNTQFSVFISLPEGESLRLDAVRISIDGEVVASHIYSFKELEALRAGGVQRIHTGNVATGRHALDVTFEGKLENGKEFSGSRSFEFEKEVAPKLLGVEIDSSGSPEDAIQLASW